MTRKKENIVERELKKLLTSKKWLVRSIEGKAGEKDGTPDILAVSPNGVNYLFEVKAGHHLTAGQIAFLKKSTHSFAATLDTDSGCWVFSSLTEEGQVLHFEESFITGL